MAVIKIWVNGAPCNTSGCDPGQPLVQFLRRNVGLVGTKSNCEGGCTGACTVLVSRWSPRLGAYEHGAMSSCSLPLAALHMANVTTVEGVGTSQNPHPIQTRLAECHAVQCGYDTPGLVMSVYAFLVKQENVTLEDLIKHCDGVISRCNGYRAVVEAVKSFVGDNSLERKKLEEKLPESLKTNDTTEVMFRGSSTVWTSVGKVHDAKELLKTNTKLFYGTPAVEMLSHHIISVKADGGAVIDEDGITIETNCTLANLAEELRKAISLETEPRQAFLEQLLRIVERIGTTQIRNRTSFGDAVYEKPEVKMIMKTLVSEVKGVTSSIMTSVKIPWLEHDEIFRFESVSNRRGNMQPVVCAALKLKNIASKVATCNVFIANEKEMEVQSKRIESIIVGSALDETGSVLITEDFLDDETLLVRNLIKKILSGLEHEEQNEILDINSTQFEEFVHGFTATDIEPLGKPIPMAAGLLCTTGEAVFVDDMPSFNNELFMEFVTSTEVHSKIKSIDASKALALDGVLHFITAKDIPEGRNTFQNFGEDDEIVFADDTVLFEGHPVGAILAVNEDIAKKASKLVIIEYERLLPVVTIEDAIESGSFYESRAYLPFKIGEPEEAFSASEHVIEGEFTTTRQEHFYEETLSALVVPINEEGEMKVYSPTPNALMTQLGIAKILNMPANRITVHVKRIGCNYGGKAIRGLPYIYAVALAANISRRPVRSVLSRTQDIQMTGQRGEFSAKYRVGVTEGKLTAVDYMLYKNGGWSADLSPDVLCCALIHSDNCYKFPTFHGTGKVCKTNTPSNCAFRAFGAPPAFAITENMMFDVSSALGLDPVTFRKENFYKAGDTTHYGQIKKEDDVTFDVCLDECIKRIDYYKEKEVIAEYNSNNKNKKRGISIHPFSYGVGVPPMYGHTGALLHVNLDGSVGIFTGGVEMGQGFYTKMLQIASQILGIPMSKIYIPESATDKVPNPLVSGGSSTADYCGNAVRLACDELNKRLAPIKDAQPKASWDQWVGMAWASRINLSVSGYYTSPADWTEYSLEKKEGNRWSYFVNGASCSIVEIDVLTGEHRLLKTEIVMDVGESINPAIDIAQIEGAFVQGYGYLAMEETKFSSEGKLLTRGHDSYSVPTISDIPSVFNVTLLRKDTPVENRRVLYSSKGIGEPPYLSGVSVFFAIKTAVSAARKDKELRKSFNLATPASPENVVKAINCD